jgi:hypothetical protein
VFTQADGARVYVKGTGGGKYDFVVEGEGGFVTGQLGVTGEELRGLPRDTDGIYDRKISVLLLR